MGKVITLTDQLPNQMWCIFLDQPEHAGSKVIVEHVFIGYRVWQKGDQAIHGAVWDSTPIEMIAEPDRVPFSFPSRSLAKEFAEKVLTLDRFKLRNVFDEIDHSLLKTVQNDSDKKGTNIIS